MNSIDKDVFPRPADAGSASFQQQVWELSDLALKTRLFEAIQSGVSRYPIFRDLRFAARMELFQLLDSFATLPGWTAQRLNARSMLIDTANAMVVIRGTRKSGYCSVSFSIWTDTVDSADQIRDTLSEVPGSLRINEPMFSIAWHFLTGRGELESVAIEEFADDRLFDEAYPDLVLGVEALIDQFLDSQETVLVLQGPPGTGKTRLIRRVLGRMSERKAGLASAVYTGDMKALGNDEIFVRFITGWEDAFIVEDADHLLKPRSQGNEHLHRFLTIADGVVSSQGRKIIFSTNLPGIGDLDEALVRPGRCFARCRIRLLEPDEAERLLQTMIGAQSVDARSKLPDGGRKPASLATVYKVVRDLRSAQSRHSIKS